MRLASTFRTVAAGCNALGALLMAQAVFPGSAQPFAHVRTDGASAVAVPVGSLCQLAPHLLTNDDVTWGS
ncbi:hypothetical protein ABZ504_55540 [Streptomyces mirabilis]|uniref:hypothetical protein n=1 Tax=Streptomyces mirabilis TaxID=68239 RepID=UPI00340157ED